MSEFEGTQIGADGERHPAGTQPTDAAAYRRVNAGTDQDIIDIAAVETTEFGRSLLAVQDADALSALTGGGLPAVSNDGGVFGPTAVGAVSFGTTYRPHGSINASGPASLAHGYAYGYSETATAEIRSSGFGSTAKGFVFGGGQPGSIVASGAGSHAGGSVGDDGSILASGNGSFAVGSASYGDITASQSGAVALGYSQNGSIISSEKGAFAFGSATSGQQIAANARNSGQFGVGTNDQESSWSVGNAIRLNGVAGTAPTTPRNGDMWVDASGNVVVRSNGANVIIA